MADVTYCVELPLPAETSKDGNNEPYRKAIWGRRRRSAGCHEARRNNRGHACPLHVGIAHRTSRDGSRLPRLASCSRPRTPNTRSEKWTRTAEETPSPAAHGDDGRTSRQIDREFVLECLTKCVAV